jgi:phenylacetate-CoA ligase
MESAGLALHFATSYRATRDFHFLDQGEIAAWQLRRIRQLIDIAYHHTDLYRKKYDAAGIHPRDIRDWQDFESVPVLTKEELIEFGPRAVDRRRAPESLFVSRSSGSSGELVSVYLDAKAMTTQAIQAIRMIKEMVPAYGPLDRELLIYTSEYPYSSIGGFYRTAHTHTLLPPRQMVERIARTRPTVIAVYPSVLREIVRLGDVGRATPQLKAVITNSEQSTQDERDFFAHQLDRAVYDEFSSEELSSVAYQCRQKYYHLTQDSSYIEVMSPNNDAILPVGQLGEIVGTCLINKAMPVIRYRQGDLASLRKHCCPCGRDGPILETFAGRKNDSFWRLDGTEVPSGQILDWTYNLILTHKLGVLEFQITQQATHNVEVRLVVDPDYNESTANEIIAWNFRRTFGDYFDVSIAVVPTITRTESGKYNPIRSMVRNRP